MICPECGVEGDGMTKWFISPGTRFCSTCHSSESQWPATMKAGGGRKIYEYLRKEARDDEPPTMRSCGHRCCRQTFFSPHPAMNQGNNRCCKCTGGSAESCTLCLPNRLESIFRGNGLSNTDAKEIAQSVLEDVVGNRFTVPENVARSRDERLEQNVRRLYHQTDERAAGLIISSQKFRPGAANCLAGSGIYFADSVEATHRKARFRGVILQADVFLGRVLRIPASGDKSITLESLISSGYDSVEIPRNGTEYVVYSYEQVINITLLDERGCKVHGCRSCRGSQQHYCNGCHDTDSDHRARNCTRGGARNSTRGGAYNSTRGGARNSTRGGAYNSTRGGARNCTRGGARNSTRGGAYNSTRGGDRNSTRGARRGG